MDSHKHGPTARHSLLHRSKDKVHVLISDTSTFDTSILRYAKNSNGQGTKDGKFWSNLHPLKIYDVVERRRNFYWHPASLTSRDSDRSQACSLRHVQSLREILWTIHYPTSHDRLSTTPSNPISNLKPAIWFLSETYLLVFKFLHFKTGV